MKDNPSSAAGGALVGGGGVLPDVQADGGHHDRPRARRLLRLRLPARRLQDAVQTHVEEQGRADGPDRQDFLAHLLTRVTKCLCPPQPCRVTI